MPLFANALQLIRENLERCQAGDKRRPPVVVIGTLTETQLNIVNAKRVEDDLPLMAPEVVFVGSHVYEQRAVKQDYLIEDILDQIESAMSSESIVIDTPYMTAMENPVGRVDRAGKLVNDRAIFECTKRLPRPELFSVVPKGDGKAKDK
jgi:hypothetical protein